MKGIGREAGFSTPLHFGRNDGIGGGLLLVRPRWQMGDEAGGADGSQVQLGSCFADRLIGFRMLGQGNEDAVRAENAGLLAGDLGDGVAEVVLMVEGDVGDDGEQGVDDIGGVQTAA